MQLHGPPNVRLTRVADIPSRRRLRSADALLVRPTLGLSLSVIGRFRLRLPNFGMNGDVTASQSLAAFRRQLKTFLFRLSTPVLYC